MIESDYVSDPPSPSHKGRKTTIRVGERWTFWMGPVFKQTGIVASLGKEGVRLENKAHGIAWADITAMRKESE